MQEYSKDDTSLSRHNSFQSNYSYQSHHVPNPQRMIKVETPSVPPQTLTSKTKPIIISNSDNHTSSLSSNKFNTHSRPRWVIPVDLQHTTTHFENENKINPTETQKIGQTRNSNLKISIRRKHVAPIVSTFSRQSSFTESDTETFSSDDDSGHLDSASSLKKVRQKSDNEVRGRATSTLSLTKPAYQQEKYQTITTTSQYQRKYKSLKKQVIMSATTPTENFHNLNLDNVSSFLSTPNMDAALNKMRDEMVTDTNENIAPMDQIIINDNININSNLNSNLSNNSNSNNNSSHTLQPLNTKLDNNFLQKQHSNSSTDTTSSSKLINATIPPVLPSISSDSHSTASNPSDFILKVSIPEQDFTKCIKCHRQQSIWSIKQAVIQTLNKSLKTEAFNYGILSPLRSGFLHDHLLVSDVLPSRKIHHAEFKQKTRVHFKELTVKEQKRVSKLNSSENELKILQCVKLADVANLKHQFLDKNFDPNFIAKQNTGYNGHSPLTLTACLTQKTHELLVALLTSGAIIDFRNRHGRTALHCAVNCHNVLAVNVLLKHDPEFWRCLDTIGRPPMFYLCPRPTLEDHYGLQDNEISSESLTSGTIKSGTVKSGSTLKPNSSTVNSTAYKYFTLTKRKELDLRAARNSSTSELIDSNSKKKSIESATKILETLFRSARYSSKFFDFQDERGWSIWHHLAYHDNQELMLNILQQAETFANIGNKDEQLKVNMTSHLTGNTPLHIAALHNSNNVAKLLIERCACDTGKRNFAGKTAFDYCIADNESNVSTFSPIGRMLESVSHDISFTQTENRRRAAELTNLAVLNQHAEIEVGNESPLVVTHSHHISTTANLTTTTSQDNRNHSQQTTGSNNSDLPLDGLLPNNDNNDLPTFLNNGMYVVTVNYKAKSKEELNLLPGDTVQVIASPENAPYWEGVIGRQVGWFPKANLKKLVDESDQNEPNYPVEQPNIQEQSNGRLTPSSNSDASMQDTNGNQQSIGNQQLENQQLNRNPNKSATTGRRVIQVQQQHKFVKIERSQTYGFGFILRGTRSHTDKKTEFQPSNLYPARQFLESVDLNGPAGAAGLAAGDYLINVNNADVRTWGHDDLVQLIRSQHSMTMHVISVTKHKGTTNRNPVSDNPKSHSSSQGSLQAHAAHLSSRNEEYAHASNSNQVHKPQQNKTHHAKQSSKSTTSSNSTNYSEEADVKNALSELDRILATHEQQQSLGIKRALNNTQGTTEEGTATLRRKNRGAYQASHQPSQASQPVFAPNQSTNQSYHHQTSSPSPPQLPSGPPPDTTSLTSTSSGSLGNQGVPHPPPPPPPKPKSLRPSSSSVSDSKPDSKPSTRPKIANRPPSLKELETVTLTPTSSRKLPQRPLPESKNSQLDSPDLGYMAQAAAQAAMRRVERMSQKSRESGSIGASDNKKTEELNARIEKMKESNNLALRLAMDAKSQSLKKRNSTSRRNVQEVFSKELPKTSKKPDHGKSETSDIAEIIPTAKSPPPEFNSSEDDTSNSEETPVEQKVTKHSSADSGVGSSKNLKNKSAPLKVSSSFAHSTNLPSSIKSTPYLDWNASQLAAWMSHIKLGPYTKIFLENEIEGAHLDGLDRDALTELGIAKLGPKLTFERELKRLKQMKL